jgi:hypothetical protein
LGPVASINTASKRGFTPVGNGLRNVRVGDSPSCNSCRRNTVLSSVSPMVAGLVYGAPKLILFFKKVGK